MKERLIAEYAVGLYRLAQDNGLPHDYAHCYRVAEAQVNHTKLAPEPAVAEAA